MQVLTTSRLSLRRLETSDAEFILRLLNESDFIRYIGDRNVRTLDDARNYIAEGPIASYEQYGFGLFLVAEQSSGAAVGMCGLLKRDTLDDVDIGFAFLEPFRSKGYALEAAQGVMRYAREVLHLPKIVAIVSPDNAKSIGLLEKIGLRFERALHLPGSESATHLFVPADNK